MSAISNIEIGTGWFNEQLFSHLVTNYSNKNFTIEDLKADSILNSCIITHSKSQESSSKSSFSNRKKKSDSKAHKASSPINPKKCQCRVWNHGYGGQCSFYKNGGTDFCKRHGAKSPGLGLITDERPNTCSTDGKILKWIETKSDKNNISRPKTIKKTLEEDTTDYNSSFVDDGSGVGDIPDSEPIQKSSDPEKDESIREQNDGSENELVISDENNEEDVDEYNSDEDDDGEEEHTGEEDTVDDEKKEDNVEPGNFDDFNLSDEDTDEEE